MNFQCEFCNKSVSSKGALKNHQQSAKYCLAIRKNLDNESSSEEEEELKCEYCHKVFTRKDCIIRHQNTFCKAKIRYEENEKVESYLIDAQLEVKDLKQKLKYEKRERIREVEEIRTTLQFELKQEKKYYETDLKVQDDMYKYDIKQLQHKLDKTRKECEIYKNLCKKKGNKVIYISDEIIEDSSEEEQIYPSSKDISNFVQPELPQKDIYVHPKLENIPIDNITPFTEAFIIEKLEKADLSQVFGGSFNGITDFIADLSKLKTEDGIERNMVCTDISRHKFYTLSPSKKWVQAR